ncbi:hypothetical protein ACJX0J_008463, partial [Zea mays]
LCTTRVMCYRVIHGVCALVPIDSYISLTIVIIDIGDCCYLYKSDFEGLLWHPYGIFVRLTPKIIILYYLLCFRIKILNFKGIYFGTLIVSFIFGCIIISPCVWKKEKELENPEKKRKVLNLMV